MWLERVKTSVKYDGENSFYNDVQQHQQHSLSIYERVKSIEVLIMRLDWGVRESAGFGNYVHADRTLILHTHSTAQTGKHGWKWEKKNIPPKKAWKSVEESGGI